MASGTFRTPTNTSAGTNKSRYIYVDWSSENNKPENKSTISWHAYVGSGNSSTTDWVMGGPITVKIDGTTVLSVASRIQLKKGMSLGSGSITVDHSSDGTKAVSVSISAAIYGSSINNTYSGTITMTRNPVFTLTINAGTGSSITVNRTSCAGAGSTGNLSNGAKLCAGDILKITYSVNSNYELLTHTVQKNTQAPVSFVSGNSYTAKGNVTVASTAQPTSSTISATSTDVNGASTITINRHQIGQYCSVKYSFESLQEKYITSSGGVSNTEQKFTSSGMTQTISFSIPSDFAGALQNKTSGTCTLTCTTYASADSSAVVGTPTTCTFTISVPDTSNSPDVSGTVVDTNATTLALTGNDKILIRYRSTAGCTITATPKSSATIAETTINGVSPTGGSISIVNVDAPRFIFRAKDSRGFIGQEIIEPNMVAEISGAVSDLTMVEYVPLTCIPVLYRDPSSNETVKMTINGNVYQKNFGAATNSLTIKVRYRESGSAQWGAWTTINQSQINLSASTSSYASDGDITLGSSFDYQKAYDFQVQATDGASVGGTSYVLSTVTQDIIVRSAIPVFDWGENDFNVNVQFNIGGVNIFDIIYPVGSVYWATGSTLPTSISDIGTWSSVTTGIAGVYAWERTA